MDVHLRDLRYFAAVAEHRHFTRAAESLHVSQPALSKQVRALERQLRTRLFERDHRTVALTAAGEALLPRAREVLAAWATAEAALTTAGARLVVGFSTGLGRGLLPAVRARLAEHAPDLELRMRQVTWDDPTGGLADRTSDAAFVWLPYPDPDGRYTHDVVVEEARMVALPAGHRLAEHPEIAFADLLDEPFLALPAESGPLREYWLATAERDGRPTRIGAEVATTEETAEALESGLGICLLSQGNVPLVKRAGIAFRPVTGLSPSRLVLAYRRDDTRPMIAALRRAVRASR
jgi:DNA-binding transcriptional LysR family regulator